MRGRFLVLEGIDGCGKTTQIKHLSKWLPDSGLMPKHSKLHITKEPGGTILGKALRELLLNPPLGKSPEPITELLLYAADRAQHIGQFILPKIEKGDWVISDRFSGSTIAYQGFGRKLNIEIIKQLEQIATRGIQPDLTLFLEIPTNESIKRRINKSEDRIESEGALFMDQVASGFSSIAKERKWITISANQKESIVSKIIERELIHHLKEI